MCVCVSNCKACTFVVLILSRVSCLMIFVRIFGLARGAKVIPPRAWSPTPAFRPLSQSLRPWSGSLYQPLLVPAAPSFAHRVPVPLPLQPESPLFSSHQHFASPQPPSRFRSFSPPLSPKARQTPPVAARPIWPRPTATAQGHWQSPSVARPSRSLSPQLRQVSRPSPASPPEPRTRLAVAQETPSRHESPPRNAEPPPQSPPKSAAEAPVARQGESQFAQSGFQGSRFFCFCLEKPQQYAE